jgi:E3 ubiquitin-protein ligase UHRF1
VRYLHATLRTSYHCKLFNILIDNFHRSSLSPEHASNVSRFLLSFLLLITKNTVQAPCQHNFCLKCFQDLVAKAKKKACPSCRHEFGAKFAANPRVNTALISAIRAVKSGKKATASKNFVRMNNDDRPDEAFTTERAQRAGRANAASGRIMVNVPNDHFGPIPAECDPRGLGIRVGDFWKDRLDCRQWGAHFPHVAGIAGQSNVGAQSVVLSGGYEDDRDEGEWFLYTGSGGRDLSGNKRTSKVQSFDQEFASMNQALKLSCERGLPVRVVRSHKEKRSAYAPTTEEPVRYDGIYRIVKCWRKQGAQGLLMCRYLFMRCDNEPAPWSSDDTGDRPRDLEKNLPKEALAEIKAAHGKEVFTMGSGKEKPYWDWNEEKEEWGWTRSPPESQRNGAAGNGKGRKKVSEHEKALKEMTCGVCKEIFSQPVSAPCGHNFCKPCLDVTFGGQEFDYDAGAATGRSLRIRKVVMPCPCCKNDLADFLRTAQVNRDLESMVQKLQKQVEADKAERIANGEEEEDEGVEEEDATPASPSVLKKKGRKGAAIGSKAASAGASPAAASKKKKQQQKTPSAPPSAAPAAAALVPRVGIASQENEADRQAIAVAQLCLEFPDFDAGLVEALIEQEEGDAQAVKMALSKMKHQMVAEEKKKAKAKQGASMKNGAGGSTTTAAAMVSPAVLATANGNTPGSGGAAKGSPCKGAGGQKRATRSKSVSAPPQTEGITPAKRAKKVPGRKI